MQHIGKVLRRIREIKGLRQEDLVTPIVSLSTIQKVEAGKRNPSHDVILSMISSLDVSYEEVLYLQNNYNLDERA
ncbi:helix-turn-helix domain-containing protein [Listeria sp. SHR_NRA_18]|uniref:helix-turn-helix domain-containing protein n=1 Tax=Listeria sp. SHR_NRA_18 TaxID=2269046 RepID=UPI001374C0E2|nr:helix-turn-helix transcriptional regulator [Listeria sp. SHR_NRA_18]